MTFIKNAISAYKIQFVRFCAMVSQVGNVILLGPFAPWIGPAHHDQTISARCYLNRHKKGWKQAHWFVNMLFFWQPNHCRISHEADLEWSRDVIRMELRDKKNIKKHGW